MNHPVAAARRPSSPAAHPCCWAPFTYLRCFPCTAQAGLCDCDCHRRRARPLVSSHRQLTAHTLTHSHTNVTERSEVTPPTIESHSRGAGGEVLLNPTVAVPTAHSINLRITHRLNLNAPHQSTSNNSTTKHKQPIPTIISPHCGVTCGNHHGNNKQCAKRLRCCIDLPQARRALRWTYAHRSG